MRILIDTLHNESCSKDREIRKLHKDAQQYEQTILGLRSEMSMCKYQTPDSSKKDAEVMAGMCCTGAGAECGEWAPVKDVDDGLREEMLNYQERIQKMESSLKSSGADARALRKANVSLREELQAARGACAALAEQARAAALRAQFKDDIIREMRRQLKHAKAKAKESVELISVKSRGSQEETGGGGGAGAAPYDQELGGSVDESHAATRTSNHDAMRDVSTCTCNIEMPVCTSTPNCSQRNLVDCCGEVSVVICDNVCPPSPILMSHNCSDLDEDIVLQCSRGSSPASVHNGSNTGRRGDAHLLNTTYEICEPRGDRTFIHSSPTHSTKEGFMEKTFEHKNKNQDFGNPKPCGSRHVDFSSSCELRPPCPAEHRTEPCVSCTKPEEVLYCAAKSVGFVDIVGKLCDLCRQILNPAPCQPGSCTHVDVSDSLCEPCQHILSSAPCPPGECRYCAVAEQFCKHCKHVTVTASSQPAKTMSYIDIAAKLCDLCRRVLDPALSQSDRTCRRISDKLCERCRPLLAAAPCQVEPPCRHCDISSRLCDSCRKVADATPCQLNKPCAFIDLTDKLCGRCKLVVDPISIEANSSCKHCDMAKNLCPECKRIVDSSSSLPDESCRNLVIADKLCEHCKGVYDSAPCQPVKSCKIIGVADKLCMSCKQAIDPCQFNICRHCDISNKLCKECKIIDCQTSRTCNYVDIASKLCQHCRSVYMNALCLSMKYCTKHVNIPDYSCEHCKLDPCKSNKPCKHCDISKTLCEDCRSIFKAVPCADKSCENKKLCENCRNVNESALCTPHESCVEHATVNKSCDQCIPVDPCKHCDVSKKLCKECRRIFDAVPCADKSCKNDDIAGRLCEHCRQIYNSTPCHSIKSCLKCTNKSCEDCRPENPCKHCNISKKLCKDCRSIFDAIPCADKSCKNYEIANKLCEHCREIYASALCPMKHVNIAEKSCGHCKFVVERFSCAQKNTCKQYDMSKNLCHERKSIFDAEPCGETSCQNIAIANKLSDNSIKANQSVLCLPIETCIQYSDMGNKSCDQCIQDNSCKHCDISKKLCNECRRIFDAVPCADKSCKNDDIPSRLCEHCRQIYNSAPCRSIGSCSKHLDTPGKTCEHCKHIPDLAPCNPGSLCKNYDITKTLCKYCKRIFDAITCADKSCQNTDNGNELCEHCRNASDTALCPPTTCTERPDASMNSCDQCKPENPCKNCNMSKTLCKECNRIFDAIPCADKSCQNIDIGSKLCGHCRSMYESAPCPPATCTESDDGSNKSCDQCKPCNLCKNCDISKKLCKQCKRIFDAVPCADKSCKNAEIANKLCEPCRQIYDSAPYPADPCTKHADITKSCEHCKYILDLTPCTSVNVCKKCDITKSLCKGCKYIFKRIPCADRSCRNLDIMDRLCDHCSELFVSVSCQEEEVCQGIDLTKKPCDLDPSSSMRSCDPVDQSCVIETESCRRCRHVPDSLLARLFKACKDVYVQVPEKGGRCKPFEELFFNDRSAGSSGADLWKCRKCACALESQSAATLTSLCPVVSQEAKSTCFDTTKESICRSSGPESPDSACASARARHYQNKLLATLQILHNKEQTVRVQTESLAVAEARVAALAARHAGLRRELERKEREILSLRQNMKECHCKLSRVDTRSVATEAEVQEMDDQKNIVKSLQNNLDVIQELYRECFYESVKQDSLIEMLRQSYLDVRQMDEDKAARISELRGVVREQRTSLDRCQDIATEVDNLKMEICNFINSSSNDSGMWEGSVVSGLNEDLQDIAAQLIKLRDYLTGDCTCGLEEENRRLRKENEGLEKEMCSLRTQISTLQAGLVKKDCQLDRQCQEQITCKERELGCIREQLQAMMVDVKEKTEICDSLTQQLTDTKAALDDRVGELSCMQQQSRIYQDTINVMREELDRSEEITKEVASLRAELCCEVRRGARGVRRAAALEGELARARGHCQRLDKAYREKTTNALSLERELDEAHARGAELCGEAGRVVRAVRCWAARMKEIHREQEKQIKLKENRLRCLQDELHKRQISVCPRLWERVEHTSSGLVTLAASTSGTCSQTARKSDGSYPTVKFCVGESRHDGTGSSGSEMAGCSTPLPCADAARSSSEPACPEHVPSCSKNLPACSPNRTCRTKSACGMMKSRSGWAGALADTPRPAPPAPLSPSEEMFSRMESLSAALADGYRRWARRAPS